MAKKATNIVTAAKGTLYAAVKKGERKGFNTLNDAIAKVFSCCGPDCCENVYRWWDKDTCECYVEYVFGGATVLELESDYKVKKANGDFNC